MIVHHAQAVQMAEIVRDKTESDDMRLLASDISLTQQAQVGIMQGWLAVWGLPITGSEPSSCSRASQRWCSPSSRRSMWACFVGSKRRLGGSTSGRGRPTSSSVYLFIAAMYTLAAAAALRGLISWVDLPA